MICEGLFDFRLLLFGKTCEFIDLTSDYFVGFYFAHYLFSFLRFIILFVSSRISSVAFLSYFSVVGINYYFHSKIGCEYKFGVT